MARVQRAVRMVLVIFFVLSVGEVFGAQNSVKENRDIVLSPADQLILDRIDKFARELNNRIDQVNIRIDQVNIRIDNLDQGLNARIDNLWITMMGGFLGVMGFIGALVFWDRRTFMKRATYEISLELKEDREKMNGIIAALKKLGARFPEVSEALRSFGIL